MVDDNYLQRFYNHCDEVGLPEEYIEKYTEQVESGYLDNGDLWSLTFRDLDYLISNIDNSM
jgi:hypothetical protein